MKMLQTIFVVCFILIALPAHAQQIFPVERKISRKEAEKPAPRVDAPFDRLQDNAWALVLTGPEEDPLFTQQMALLEPQAEKLKSREIVVIHFHGRSLKIYPDMSVADYRLPSLKGSKSGESSHRKIERLERQLQTDDDIFSVVLVGMDGLTKYVWLEPVKPSAIYQVMDHPVPFVPPVLPQKAAP